MQLDAIHLWRSLPEDRRQLAGEAFYHDDSMREFHRAADSFIARTRNFRPQFVRRLPVSKRANYLAHLPIPPDFAAQLLASYHFSSQRPLMTAFLNALEIPNDNGLISDGAEVSKPSPEKLKAAVEAMRSQFSEDDVQLYLQTLYLQNPHTWAGVQEFLPQSAESAG